MSLENKLVTFLFLFSIMILPLESHCPPKTSQYVDDNSKIICVPCPDNCSMCFLDKNHQPECISCEEGFYQESKKSCKACHKNCARCEGPKIKQCYALKQSYFVSNKNKINKCDEKCSRCHTKTECMSCASGYYTSSKIIDPELGMKVECTKCNIDNCRMCEKKKDQMGENKYVTCMYCDPQYAVVSGKCLPCPEGCRYCRPETLECTFCETGHFLNHKTNKCELVTKENCSNMDGDGNCTLCESKFYLDGKDCKTCNSKEPHCTYCNNKGSVFECFGCGIGYHKTADKKCVACPEKCNHCSDKQCFSCEEGLYYDKETNKCITCSIANCKRCRNGEYCESCEKGFYFKEGMKSCEKCSENCLSCFREKDNCMRCPVTYYTLQIDTVSDKQENKGMTGMLLGGIFGIGFGFNSMSSVHIKVINKCVKKCPEKYGKKKVRVNKAMRHCNVMIDEDAHDMDLPAPDQSSDFYQDLSRLKAKYDSDIAKLDEGVEHIKDKKKSSACNYRGDMKKKERGNYDSYFFCRCDEGYIGDNCQLSMSMVRKYQNRIMGILNDIDQSFSVNNNHTRKLFLDSLLMINKFKSNTIIVKKNLEIVKKYLRHDKNIDNRKKLYEIYDAFLLNLFDLMDDLKRIKLEEYEVESDVKQQNDQIYEIVYEIVKTIEESFEDLKFSHSFLQYDMRHYIAQNTYSYIIAEYRLSNYKPEKGFFVVNPNIDKSTYVNFASNKIFLYFNMSGAVDLTKINLQMIVFSASLFEDKINYYNDVLVSNLVYLRVIDPQYPHIHVSMAGASIQTVEIKFALLFVPIFDEVEKNIFCKSYNFDDNSLIRGELVKFIDAGDDEDNVNNAFAICKFKTDFKYRSHYMGVSMVKI